MWRCGPASSPWRRSLGSGEPSTKKEGQIVPLLARTCLDPFPSTLQEEACRVKRCHKRVPIESRRLFFLIVLNVAIGTLSSVRGFAADGELNGSPRSASARKNSAKKNIVLIVTDDQGCDAGCYGNAVIKTPNLDRLAAEGTVFTHAFCTTASCSASRSVILSGLHNHANGQYGHAHDYHKFSSYSDVKSLPVRLAEAGYRTALVGKYHVLPESVYAFQIMLQANSRNAVEMAERSREVIQAASDRPFFLYFCTSDPHRGGGSVEDDPLRPDRFGNRPDGYPGVDEVEYSPDEVLVPDFLPDTAVCRAELAQYYQSVSRIDQGLGRLVQILKNAGQYDNTLILYISDHGIAFPGGKTTVYEPGLRSPCVVRHPEVAQRGIQNDAMISWVDLTPTILEFAGALPEEPEATRPLQGRSFLSIVDQPHSSGWDDIYASHTFHEITMYYPMRVVRERQYKLIWNVAHQLPYPFATDLWAAPTWQAQYQLGMDAMYGQRTVGQYMHRAEFELFDLNADPHETVNLANDPAHEKTLARLQDKLRAFQENTKDPWRLKWDYE
jgi:N-sulfoglucosamine sulfohydrolase